MLGIKPRVPTVKQVALSLSHPPRWHHFALLPAKLSLQKAVPVHRVSLSPIIALGIQLRRDWRMTRASTQGVRQEVRMVS